MKRSNFVRYIGCCLMMVFLFSVSSFVFAEEGPYIAINGQLTSFSNKPFLKNGTTYIPLRALAEILECNVSWNNQKQIAEIKDKSSGRTVAIGAKNYTVNNVTKKLDTPNIIKNGVTFVPLRIAAESLDCNVEWYAPDNIIFIEKYRTVEVSNATELLNNAKSYTKLVLTQPEYDLTNVGNISNHKVKADSVFDGVQYVISGVSYLSIEPKKGVKSTLLVTPRYANVLPFEDCSNITIKGITAGHTIDKGYCTGGVIELRNSDAINVEDCKLYGCGTYGVIADESVAIHVKNSEIYECSYGAIDLANCYNVKFSNCTFRDNEEFDIFSIKNCNNVEIANSVIKNNRVKSKFASLISAPNSVNINFKNCKFQNNTYSNFSNGKNIELIECDL